jgi:hypothetical protein
MSRSSKISVSLAGAAVAMSLTACGSSAGDDFAAQPVKKITAASEADMKALKSLTFDGSITQDGDTLDIKLSSDTEGTCSGTLGISGGTAQLLGVDGAEYLKGDEKFWTASTGAQAAQVMAVLGDRWAKLPAGSEEFSAFCDLDKMLESLGDDDSGDEKLTKGKVTKVAGKDAIEIITKKDDGTTHAWVATEGKHYVLKLEHEGDEPGSIAFSDFDEPVDAEAPAKDEYLDMGALG